MIAFTVRNWLEKRHSKQTHVFTFALCTASRIFWQSSQFSASGFFDDHVLPGFRSAIACFV